MRMVRTAGVALVGLLLVGWLDVRTAVADEMGRLFFTPGERRTIDEARNRYDPTRQEVIVKAGPAPVAVAAPPPPPPLPSLEVGGLVIRSSGRNAAWVNGTPLSTGDSTESGIRVEAGRGGSVRFILPDGEGTAPVRPGQRLDPNVGRIKERYSLTPEESAAGG